MNPAPEWAPQPLVEVLKDSVFCSNSCGMLWSKWDTCTHCGYSGRGCIFTVWAKCAPGPLVKNGLWGWKTWFSQIKCAGTVFLINGHSNAVHSCSTLQVRGLGSPLKVSSAQSTWEHHLFAFHFPSDIWKLGRLYISKIILSFKKYQDFSFHLCSCVGTRVSISGLWFWGCPPLFMSQVLLPPGLLHGCFLDLQTADHSIIICGCSLSS